MLHRFLTFALLGALVAAFPLGAADDKKDKKDDAKNTPIDSDKLAAGDYSGKLLTLPDSDGAFTLQIDKKRYEPKNPEQLNNKEANLQNQIQRAQQKIAQLQAQIANARTAREAAQHAAQLQQETAHLQQLMSQSQLKPSDLKEVVDSQVYDMKLTDGADIRYMNLPTMFDDDGKPKKYTEAEKQELKGKKRTLPGYEGKIDDLKVGQTVKVTLARVYPKKDTTDPKKDDTKPDDAKKDDPKKDAPKADDAKKDAPKADDVKKDDVKKDDPKKDDKPAEKKMQVKMIVILEDPPEKADPKDKKKKDK
jgi:hypothetical protein